MAYSLGRGNAPVGTVSGRFCVIGDSIAAQSRASTANVIGWENVGYVTALRNLSFGALFCNTENVYAVSGTRSDEWIDNGQLSSAIADPAKIVCFVAPTNDVGQWDGITVTADRTKSNIRTILNALSAAGKLVFVHAIMPRMVQNDTLWANNATIAVGDIIRTSGNRLYVARTAGTTTVEPTHTTGESTTGGITWAFQSNVTPFVSWASGQTIVANDVRIGSNGQYYLARNGGTTSGSSPSHTTNGQDVTGADGIIWTCMSTITRQKERVRNELNAWLHDYIEQNPQLNVNYIDSNALLSNANGTCNNALFRDGLHTQHAATLIIANAFWTSMRRVVASGELLLNSAANVIDPTLNLRGNLLSNGLMLGTTTSGFTSPSTGNIAPSWNGTRQSGTNLGTLVGTFAKVARTDGGAGEWQQITVSGTPDSENAIIMAQTITSNYSVGDTLEFMAEVQWDAGCVLRSITAELRDTATVTVNSRDSDADTGAYFHTNVAGHVLLRTQPLTIGAGNTSVLARIILNVRTGVAAAGVVRIGRCIVRKVLTA